MPRLRNLKDRVHGPRAGMLPQLSKQPLFCSCSRQQGRRVTSCASSHSAPDIGIDAKARDVLVRFISDPGHADLRRPEREVV